MKAMRNAYATHTDFGFLKGFIKENPKAIPSNVDMIYERKGKFLIGEWKRDNEKISIGQEILLKNLAKQENFIVLIIYGNTDNETPVINKFYRVTSKGCKVQGKGLEELKDFMNRWYSWANGI